MESLYLCVIPLLKRGEMIWLRIQWAFQKPWATCHIVKAQQGRNLFDQRPSFPINHRKTTDYHPWASYVFLSAGDLVMNLVPAL